MNPNEQPYLNAVIEPAGDGYEICYRTGMTVYNELFSGGQLMSGGWNGAGYRSNVITFPRIPRLDPDSFVEPHVFRLDVDGMSLDSHWRWVGSEQQREQRGLRVTIELRHELRPIVVRVHTLLDGTPILTRWLDIVNAGDQPAALGAVATWSGGLQTTKHWETYLKDGDPLYSIGYMADHRWGGEGQFQWRPLPQDRFGFGRGQRHRHPMFLLRNEATGEHFVGQLAWSGDYEFMFELDADPGGAVMGHDGHAHLSFRIGPRAPSPLRVIAPGEAVASPEAHLGMLFGGLDECIQAMHDHMRRSVFTIPEARGRGNWVEMGLGAEVEMSEAMTYHQIEVAAELGVEVFFIDAGWYLPPGDEHQMGEHLGDWRVDPVRYPDGLQAIRDKVREHGMLFGLWVEIERLGKLTELYREHPDWYSTAYNGVNSTERMGGMIDFARDDVAAWAEATMARVIEEHELDMFRLDYNAGHLKGGGYTMRDGYVENSYWRYYEHFDAIFDRLRKRFPDVIFENCASGGARTDIGTVRRFSHTWVTDWQVAPRSFSITNGMTMALPPEYVDRLVAGQSGHVAADMAFQMRQLLFVRPTVSVFHPLGSEGNPQQLAIVKHHLELYKSFVRGFMNTGRIYHHTPQLDGFEPNGWGVLELASRERDRGIAGLFLLSNAKEHRYHLRLRGLDRSRMYKVTWDNSAQSAELSGFVLMEQGITVRLEGALTSELLVFEAI
ncbi:alpha-galactosidase [Paenibacillus sp. 598K]|uniref:alpha-galactosidase n=1 Tax=Paenibacillus sp. 598K TaxID=1117987 RepID=UPI000FF9704C|nr:alpha-galactosidase [Paenibacillus sp. 598K]GBF75710.1 alpha-galactosidase [Paenibacillus sp. 598K]